MMGLIMQSLDRSLGEEIGKLQHEMLRVKQLEIPVQHYFADGFYAREMFVKAGVILVGKIHKSEHLCIIQKGKVKVISDEFVGEVQGPYTYVSKPGTKRAMHVLEDLTWTTIHLTDETDLVTLEDLLIEHEPKFELTKIARDKADFEVFLLENNMTVEQAQKFSEVATPLEYIDLEFCGLKMTQSERHGFGIFATSGFAPDDIICAMLVESKRTQAGRYINHSPDPNTKVTDGGHILVAKKVIQSGDELTLNYREVLLEVLP